MMRILVTSASGANGDGYGTVLGFGPDGKLAGPFSMDPRITDPRGMSLDPSGALVYLNSGDDRILALSLHGHVVRDSGPLPGLDPGGGEFGPDGRYYVTMRRQGTIGAIPAALDEKAGFLLPEGIVPFPRGFGFGDDGRIYLSSGVAPSGEGDNTIVVFDRSGALRTRRLVNDPELSPLDLKLAPNGNVVVASEWPFGAADAVTSVREYDPATGQLVRVFAPGRSAGFRRPRGLRFGPGGRLYCVGEDQVVAFDFDTGNFVGPVVQLARLNGQALVLVPEHAHPPA
jgi:DNA-binding beta-propeller fold protein YncE